MLVRIGELPEEPLAAAARFYGEVLERIEDLLVPPPRGEELTLVFAPADHTHRAWQVAAVQELARKYAPRRVNAIASADAAAIAAAERYLGGAPGVTGQLLPLDGNGAG